MEKSQATFEHGMMVPDCNLTKNVFFSVVVWMS